METFNFLGGNSLNAVNDSREESSPALRFGDFGETTEKNATFPENNVEGDGPSSSKRIKKDEEGFVTPATPDIPKASILHNKPTNHATESFTPEHSKGVGPGGDAPVEDPIEDGQSREFSQTSPRTEVLQTSSQPTEHVKKEVKPRRTLPKEIVEICTIVEESNRGTKGICTSFSKLFSDSVNFELISVSRLDKLLKEAKEIEQSLVQQKDQLRQRLTALTGVLQGD